jgi:hypothetical protein
VRLYLDRERYPVLLESSHGHNMEGRQVSCNNGRTARQQKYGADDSGDCLNNSEQVDPSEYRYLNKLTRTSFIQHKEYCI